MNRLLDLYHSLNQAALNLLEVTSRYPGQVLVLSEPQVGLLREMDLLEFRDSQGWQPNWWGWAVLNWHRHLREALDRKVTASAPRELENGTCVGPACADFRPLLFSGVSCWCGRLRSAHADQAPEAALRYLGHCTRNQSLSPLKERVSGRSFRDLARELPSDLREMLDLIEPEGLTLSQLYQFSGGRLRFQAIQESVNLLLELDLVYFQEETLCWCPSWDGQGLIHWLRERVLRNFLGKPTLPVYAGENGETVLPAVCDRYRPILSKGSKACRCGHPRGAHTVKSQGRALP